MSAKRAAEDAAIVVAHVRGHQRPAGQTRHIGEEGRALLNAPYNFATECYHWTPPATGQRGAAVPLRLWLLNRLDSGTSGAILVAADEALALEIRALFRHLPWAG